MLSYRTVLLTQTGICSGILPMALRSTSLQSLASSEEPSNRQNVNTGLLNCTTPAPMLVECGRACKLLWTTNGSTAASFPVTQAYQTTYILSSGQATLKHAGEHQLFWTTV
jgi:hypothetical protein